MPPVEIAAPPPSPAPEIVAAQLNKAPLCLPPRRARLPRRAALLTVAEALRLERTSRRWRAWLLSADHIWQQLAASSGVSLRCAGPLAPFFRVASWRRVCVELVGALSRDLRGEDAFLEDAAPGAIVEVFETVAPEREYTVPVAGEVFEPAPSFRPSDRGVPVRLRDNQHAWATKYRVLAPRTPRWWRAVCDVDLDDAAARDFCAGLAGRHWVAEPGGVFTFCASRTVMSCVDQPELSSRRRGEPLHHRADLRRQRRVGGARNVHLAPRRTTASQQKSGAGPGPAQLDAVAEFLSAACDGAHARRGRPQVAAPRAAGAAPGRGARADVVLWRITRRRSGGATTTRRRSAPVGPADAPAACSPWRTRACRSSTPPSRRRGASCTRSRTSCRAILVDGCHLMIMRARRGALGWGPPRILLMTTKGILLH